MDAQELDLLYALLARHPETARLGVTKYGESLTLTSGEGPEAEKQARLTRLGRGRWAISLPRRNGNWEKTPFAGPMENMVAMLTRGMSSRDMSSIDPH